MPAQNRITPRRLVNLATVGFVPAPYPDTFLSFGLSAWATAPRTMGELAGFTRPRPYRFDEVTGRLLIGF